LANTAVIEEEPWQSATWRLRLDLLIHGRGHYEAAWRHPAASPLPLTDIRYFAHLAQKTASVGNIDTTRLARRPATMAAVAR
jgi:hypothetical protein